jgi:hypothetical protein
MSLKGWLMRHLPRWLNPVSPWGEKGRPHDPRLHSLTNKQQEISLRLDRLNQRARRETEERGATRTGTRKPMAEGLLFCWVVGIWGYLAGLTVHIIQVYRYRRYLPYALTTPGRAAVDLR